MESKGVGEARVNLALINNWKSVISFADQEQRLRFRGLSGARSTLVQCGGNGQAVPVASVLQKGHGTNAVAGSAEAACSWPTCR